MTGSLLGNHIDLIDKKNRRCIGIRDLEQVFDLLYGIRCIPDISSCRI